MGEHLVSLKTYFWNSNTSVEKKQTGYFPDVLFVLIKPIRKRKDTRCSKWAIYFLRLSTSFPG